MSDDTIALEAVIEGDANPDAYNEQVEQRFDERFAALADQERDAVDALLDEAELSADTETVEFPSGLEIEVRTRIPVDVEQRLERLEHLEAEGAPVGEIAAVNCEALAGMCVTDGYDSAETWLVAYEKNGMHWLGEMTSRIVEPATANAESLGNRRGR
jgi:hypothetical protein